MLLIQSTQGITLSAPLSHSWYGAPNLQRTLRKKITFSSGSAKCWVSGRSSTGKRRNLIVFHFNKETLLLI